MTIKQGPATEPQTPEPSTAAVTAARFETPARRALDLVGRYYILLATVVLIAVMLAFSPSFATPGNLSNLLLQVSFSGIVAIGMTMLIAGGLFDLSVAGIAAVCAVVLALVLPHTTIGLAILVALAVGAGLGAVNGLVVTRMRIPAFIATLGTYNVFLALAFMITDGGVVGVSSTAFRSLVMAKVGIVPVAFIALVLFAIGGHLLLQHTYFGRSLRAVGSNERAATVAGFSADGIKIAAFVITGLLTAIAAVFLTGMLSSANGVMANGLELSAITIAVVGGTALRGGRATMLGTFVAAVFVGLVNNALNLMRVDGYWQYIATGLVLIAALLLGRLRTESRIRGE